MSTSAARLTAAVLTLAAAVGFVLARRAPPITAVDQEQARLNQAAPVPRAETTIGQTFFAAHDGLSAAELLAVVYPDSPPGAGLTLRLLDADGRVVAQSSFSRVAHNAPLRLNFNPLPHSAGKTYTLVLEGTPDNTSTVWAYGLDGYTRGALLVNGAPAPGDLRFSTTYTYLWADVIRDTVIGLSRLALLALPLWLILFAPGLLLVDWAPRLQRSLVSRWARWGLALGLSLSLLPLAWLWMTTLGLKWSAITLGVVYVSVGLAVIWRGLTRWRVLRPAIGTWLRGLTLPDMVMALILLLSLAARLLAARDLAFPPWVDSPHHLSIVRLLVASGRVPADYLPLLPIDHFIYHFGFHALAATAHWFTSLSLPETFLLLGQVLNGLVPLAAYTFVAGLTARPRAGLAAAFFVGLVSFFPGYYLSWGRYTQLTGVLILAPALAAVWRLAAPVGDEEMSGEGLSSPFADMAVTGLLGAGLLLTHYRVLVFFGIFTWVALAAGGRGGWKRVAMAAVIGVLVAGPWLWRLGLQAMLPMLKTPGHLASPSGYNAFPTAYFQSGLERGWILVALLAMGAGLLRRERAVWATAGWVAATFALLNIGPGTWLVNNNAWAITLFLPGALGLGWGTDHWVTIASAMARDGAPWPRRTFGVTLLSLAIGLATYAGWQGLYAQVNIANPATILATADDLPALEWVEQHVPDQAVFLINGWLWQNGLWAGSDGGAWLWPLVGWRTTLPPLDYSFQPGWLREINTFNERAAQIQDAGAPETLALLRAAGVTHVFIGAKGGTLKPELFVDNPNYRLLYTNGAAWVFEVEYASGSFRLPATR